MVPLKIVSNVSRFKPALNLTRVLADLNRGSNSLNSISGHTPHGYNPTKLTGMDEVTIPTMILLSQDQDHCITYLSHS